MFFKGRSKQDVPAVPASLNHDSFELNNDTKAAYLRHDTAGDITPYLGLRARLSQIWINRWTVLLLLVLARVLIQTANLNVDLADAKTKALSACTKVEDIGSAMASMPHYLSVGVNALAADGITKVINGFVDILMMILTGVEQLIMFVINMYVGTYACLIAAFIHGGLDVSISAVQDVTSYFNTQIDNIATSIDNDIASAQTAINNFISGIENVGSIFGANSKPPTIDISGDINNLKNIQIDDTKFVGDLIQLNSTIPTFDQVENLTQNAISIPFDMIKQLLNNSYAGYSFDQSIFPVADKESLSFCSNNSILNDFFQALFDIVATAKVAFIVALAVLAILACIPMTWLEIRRYRKQQRHARVFTKYGYDPMDVVYIASRPITATAGIHIASRFSGKRQLLVRWVVAYGTSLPAIFVLSLALAGFFSCLCQFVLLKAVEKEAPALASEIGNFAGEIVTTLEDVSERWATDANNVILGLQNDINKDVLDYVVNATEAVNNTLNTFDNDIKDALGQFFNGSVLYDSVMDVFNCLVGRKIDDVEEGLTWVRNNAHVTLPLFPNDTFSLGANESITNDTQLTSFLSSPSSVTTDDITSAVDYVINDLHNGIIQEALISCALLLVYIIVVLIGVIRSLSGMAVPGRARGDGGQRFVDPKAAIAADDGSATYTGDKRGGPSPRSPGRARFPQFDEDTSAAVNDDWYAAARDEKVTPAAEEKRQVRGGKIGKAYHGHTRQSSYGKVEDADR